MARVVEFHLWAPRLAAVTLRLLRRESAASGLASGSTFRKPQEFPMLALGEGYWGITLPASAGDRYQYVAGSLALPDPVSRFLPEGVHGPSEIVDPRFAWSDERWRGLALSDFVLYELHIGTFTPGGTLDSACSRLDYLHDLGITAIELMPVNAVPGARNWGYDGVGLYAVQSNYGGPEALAPLCRCGTSARARRVDGCCVQPPGQRGELSLAIRSVLQQPTPDSVGQRHQL